MTAPASRAVGPNGDAAAHGGELGPLEIAQLVEAYYPRLKGLVHAQMARLSGRSIDQFTESPTVHTDDLCMELLRQRQPFRDAEHMMAVASIRCTQLIVDYLRRRARKKRGGGRRGTAVPSNLADPRSDPAQWMLRDGVGDALTRFAEEFPRQAQTLMLRTFFDRSTSEVAEILGTSTATVERDMRSARAYLRVIMDDGLDSSDEPATHSA